MIQWEQCFRTAINPSGPQPPKSPKNHGQSGAGAPRRAANNILGIDSLDIKIIEELLAGPDVSSQSMAKKFGIPLSTIQRRKTKLEGSVLKKKYELTARDLGWRNAEILMLVEKGRADHVANELIQKFDNVTSTSMRINSGGNLGACISYRNSDELHDLMESIRRMPDITNIQWTEIVRELGDKNLRLARLVFDSLQ